jgi:outer membrane protein assembly factor BamB
VVPASRLLLAKSGRDACTTEYHRSGAFRMMFATIRRVGLAVWPVLTAAALGLAASTSPATVEAPAAEKPADKGVAGPGDAPMFGGTPQRNLVNTTDKNILTDFDVQPKTEKNVKWKAQLGTYAFGGPVIAGGRVFVGTNNNHPRDPKITGDKGVVMCFDEKTGDLLWQIVHDKLENGAIDPPDQGVASTPAVDGDRLYYVSNRCELVCADVKGDPEAKKGKILWSLDMIKELKVYPGGINGGLANCSPVVVDDLVYVVTSNGVDGQKGPPEPKAPSFLAVDKNTGRTAWKSALPGANILDGQWGNPAVAEVGGKKQVIFPGGDGWLYAFEAKSGDLLWKFDCNPKDTKYKSPPGTRNYLVATPVVADGKVYVGVGREPEEGVGGPGHLWCIDPAKTPKNKDKDLSPVDNNFDPKSVVNKDSGLVWHFGGEIMPKPAAGEREYHFGRTLSTVAVHDGLVYAADFDGFFYCLDAATGKKLWDHDMSGEVWASPYYVDGKVFMGVSNGDLFVFSAGKDKKEPTKIETGQHVYVPLVAAHGALFINTGEWLYAIK